MSVYTSMYWHWLLCCFAQVWYFCGEYSLQMLTAYWEFLRVPASERDIKSTRTRVMPPMCATLYWTLQLRWRNYKYLLVSYSIQLPYRLLQSSSNATLFVVAGTLMHCRYRTETRARILYRSPCCAIIKFNFFRKYVKETRWNACSFPRDHSDEYSRGHNVEVRFGNLFRGVDYLKQVCSHTVEISKVLFFVS